MKVPRCPACTMQPCSVDYDIEGYEISACCDEYAETIYLCEECGDNTIHPGLDICFECLLKQVIADPREIDQCTDDLAREIARALAERVKPMLSVRQAA